MARLKQGQSPAADDVLGPSSCAGCFDGSESAGAQVAVQELQILLVGLGLLVAEASTTGFYGSDTYSAVRKFQMRAYPTDESQWDGRVGKSTKAAIQAAYSKLREMTGGARPGTAVDPGAETKIYDQPWFWPAVVVGSLATVGVIVWRVRS